MGLILKLFGILRLGRIITSRPGCLPKDSADRKEAALSGRFPIRTEAFSKC